MVLFTHFVVIPACNEEGSIEKTVRDLHSELTASLIDNEILVINNNSKDGTERLLKKLCDEISNIRYLNE